MNAQLSGNGFELAHELREIARFGLLGPNRVDQQQARVPSNPELVGDTQQRDHYRDAQPQLLARGLVAE